MEHYSRFCNFYIATFVNVLGHNLRKYGMCYNNFLKSLHSISIIDRHAHPILVQCFVQKPKPENCEFVLIF